VSGFTLGGGPTRNYSVDGSASVTVSGVAKGDIKVMRGDLRAPVTALGKVQKPEVAAVAAPVLPAKFDMDGNAPNPFQSGTSIGYRLPSRARSRWSSMTRRAVSRSAW
jgi:hypothetical protein